MNGGKNEIKKSNNNYSNFIGIMLIGIKYMLGSVEEKAEYKKTMIPYIIGCIFIFSISTIVSVIYSLVSQM